MISGYATNPELSQAVSQMQVSLWGTKVSGGTIQNQFEQIASVSTAGDGSFNFKFSKAVYSSLKMVFFRNDYFQQEQAVNPDNLAPGKEYKINVQVHALGWLKTMVQNTGTQHSEDELLYQLSLPYTSCTTCCSTNQRYFSGMAVDTSWVCHVYGGSKVSIQWSYSYNSLHQPHFDTLSIPINDTVVYPISY
jgi:hypothetical protein